MKNMKKKLSCLTCLTESCLSMELINPVKSDVCEDFSDLSETEFIEFCEISKKQYEVQHKPIADLDKIETKVKLKMFDFNKVTTETKDNDGDIITRTRYSGRIKYKIYTVPKEQNFMSPRFFDPEFQESAFNTVDFSRNERGFDKFGYKVAKTKKGLIPLIITYSCLVENGSSLEQIEEFKQKILARYSEYIELKQAYISKHF